MGRHQVAYTVATLLHNRDLTMTIGSDTVAVVDAVPVLQGVLFSPDLSLEKHATSLSAKCFYSVSCDVYDAHLTVTVQRS